MNKLEKALEHIANGAVVVQINGEKLDLHSVRRLMAACSATSSNVKKLVLWTCGLDAEVVEVIASSLRSSSALTWLYLDCNKDIGPWGAQSIFKMLLVNTALKYLHLFGCFVGDEGAGHLAVALRRNRMLEELFLGNNDITHVGAAAFAAELPFNQTLKNLNLDNNPLGDGGVETLAKAVCCSGLCKLWLTGTQFGERGCAALVEMLKNGSRLRTLATDPDHWPALEEGFRCNGWLWGFPPEQYIERNNAMHLRARKSAYTLLLIRKLRRTALSSFPKDVVRDIAQFLYSTRGETKQQRK
jgi:hypothetical protein